MTRTLDMRRADWLVRIYTAVDAFQRLHGVVADTREILARRAPELLVAARFKPLTPSDVTSRVEVDADGAELLGHLLEHTPLGVFYL